ncbi:MAG: FAD-dependent oxidoreductase [Desulfohalobiaceae bacterium]
MSQEQERAIQIHGVEDGHRLESRILEERLQQAVADGHTSLRVQAMGHHGIAGRLWRAGDDEVEVTVHGPSGQRLGSMGFSNTRIVALENASDDVGWLNAGADITVRGHASNGVANAMAQGRVSIGGNIGSRGMTMTKHNPRFDPPEMWVLGSVGDYFAEFMAGGVAVICGHEPQNPENILGYRPCVGMVGGRIFFRGPHRGYSQVDAELVPITDQDWHWLRDNLAAFLERIGRTELLETLADRDSWQLLQARSPFEKTSRPKQSMQAFRQNIWDRELGRGGLIGDLSQADRSPIPVITTGELRRFVPVWANRKYAAPCEASCPTGMPVQERWRLIREGRVDEGVDLALAYTPFPASICGYLCPNLCMQGCTRGQNGLLPVDVPQLGKKSLEARPPSDLPEITGRKVAVIGGGPAGLSAAWQLRQQGHNAVVFDRSERLGGKMSQAIPSTRIPEEVLQSEIERIREVLPHVHLQQELGPEDIQQLKLDYDYVVLAVGAQQGKKLPVPGNERLLPALEFLRDSREGRAEVGRRVVIIGAGNVGCDAATEANRLGAGEITLIDIQEPASFGRERREAEEAGAVFRWPVFTQEVREDGVLLTSGELIPADTVIVSVGDQPETSTLPSSVELEGGFVQVNEQYRTSDPAIFAVGDAVGPGLLTDAVGAGQQVARAIEGPGQGREPESRKRQIIDTSRIRTEYFDPRVQSLDGLDDCSKQCASCGTCRDCGVCAAICPQAAISRVDLGGDGFEMRVDPERCIGCGFCAGACPCGIWELEENDPLPE